MIVVGVLVLLVVLMILGLPLFFAMGVTSMVYLWATDVSLALMTQRMTAAVDSFVLLAVPLFYLAGELLNACKLTDRIVAMSRALVGHIHGGLAQVNILASLIFAGMSGSATADTAALGSVLVPSMKEEGYPAPFSAAVTVASAMVGPIIPPSVGMVIVGAVADISIGRLLLAGILPGLTIGAILMIYTYFYARYYGLPRYPRAPLRTVMRESVRGSAAILMPVIIVVGIMSGVFTPTEAAGAAVLYALVVGLIVYRNVPFLRLWQALTSVALGSARILAIISVAATFSWIMVREQVPQILGTQISTITENPTLVLALMVLLLLAAGLVLVASSAEIVLAPILVPVAVQFGIDPVHFGVLIVFVLIVGGGTPPVGVLLYIAQDIADVPFPKLVRAMLPFYVPLFLAILLLMFFPQISLWIPNMVFGEAGG
ncbi:TRAP transporter large permease [Psychromarinibacter halotolerans]|uniref:TRAP transporter large permease protein n=1 Tax=Psychromarinibacter halotolerans TaxID=1775175 RepID=A0ABV7GYE6_9RHOB|nr:TRAP transporter large permease [Psychromarinibacter halotolerans]MDF0597548.1 TRAP transporter large permease [Psychromarinibacter halotolerans]